MDKGLKMNFGMNLRRLRQNLLIRDLTKECFVSVQKMIQPLFVVEGLDERQSISGLTGVFRETAQSLLNTVEKDLEKGVKKFILFGVPQEKKAKEFSIDFTCSQIQELKSKFGKDIFLVVDVCLCSHTIHGHCGILNLEGDHIDNSRTVHELVDLSIAYAQAGADCVAPSDMMDGRIQAIRRGLDASEQEKTLIMSYSAKFYSKFYGPFRLAADSAPKRGSSLSDRSTYQIDPSAPKDAFSSSFRDFKEGADILMVKPGLPYLDILAKLSREIQKPWAVYQVSGEYASIELMAQHGLMNGPEAHVEVWTALMRAGASMIITYGARFAQEYLEMSL